MLVSWYTASYNLDCVWLVRGQQHTLQSQTWDRCLMILYNNLRMWKIVPYIKIFTDNPCQPSRFCWQVSKLYKCQSIPHCLKNVTLSCPTGGMLVRSACHWLTPGYNIRQPNFAKICISRGLKGLSIILLRYAKTLNNIMYFGFLRSNENGKRY